MSKASEPNDNGVIEPVEGCKPCPFCGCERMYIQVFCEGVDHAIGCTGCFGGWSSGNFNSNAEAIAAWNRRIGEPAGEGGGGET